MVDSTERLWLADNRPASSIRRELCSIPSTANCAARSYVESGSAAECKRTATATSLPSCHYSTYNMRLSFLPVLVAGAGLIGESRHCPPHLP